jgi:hypothetical protein
LYPGTIVFLAVVTIINILVLERNGGMNPRKGHHLNTVYPHQSVKVFALPARRWEIQHGRRARPCHAQGEVINHPRGAHLSVSVVFL